MGRAATPTTRERIEMMEALRERPTTDKET